MGDWIEDHLGWILAFLIAGIVFAVVIGVRENIDQANRFIADCVADGHKQYECQAMWRAGDSHMVPAVIPMVVR